MADPLARRTLMDSPAFAHFRRWSILPMAAITRSRCSIRIDYQDARFGMRPSRGRLLGQSAALPTGASGC
jgi:hypothetical protein